MASHRVGYDWACMTEQRLWDLRSTNPGPQLRKHQVLTARLPGISYHILRCQLPGCKLRQSTSLYVHLKTARDWIINILITKKKWELCDGMEVLVNALVGIILPYITVSNLPAQLTQCYVNYVSKKLEKKNLWKKEKNLCYFFRIHQKPRGCVLVLQVQVQCSWGGRRTAYSLVTCPRLSALAPATGGN